MAPGSANPPRLKFTSFWQLYDHVYVPITDKSNYLSYTYASVETRLIESLRILSITLYIRVKRSQAHRIKSYLLSLAYASVETRLTVYSKADIYIDRTKKLYPH